MMEELLIGLIGAGNMGKSLASGVAACDLARIAAISDPVEGAAEAAAEDISEGDEIDTYTDLGEMLAREDIAATLVAAPNYLHPELVIRSAEAEKHVFCEKPMALNVADARSMIEACETNDVKLMIGQVLRYNSRVAFILEMIRNGDLGKPFGMQISRIGGGWTAGSKYHAPWRLKKETCGGPLFEISAHEIDFMRQVLGEACTVYASMDNYVSPEVDYEDFVQMVINFEEGGRGALLAGHAARVGKNDGKIFLTAGTIYYDNSIGEVTWLGEGEEIQKISYDELDGRYERGVNREIREFVEAVVDDAEVTIPGIEGLRNTEIAQAAGISAASNRVVELAL